METKVDGQKEMSRHTLIMALCCLMPLAILAALWMIGVSGSYLVFGLILLCPLRMHLLMMRGMHEVDGGHRH